VVPLIARAGGAGLIAALLLAMASFAGADTTERLVTSDNRSALNLTVYNGGPSGGTALVHDTRHVALHGGLEHLAWRDVSAQIQPETAILVSPSKPDSIRMLEQNFDYDVLQPDAILDKYVGQDVIVVHGNVPGLPYSEHAKLLSNFNGVVLQYGDRIETSVVGRIVFPKLPGGLRDKPTLILDVDERAAGSQDLDLAYLTGGLSWRADYVGTVSADERSLDLSGLITLSNQSGTSFPNAQLQLVAGNVNIVPPVIRGAVPRTEVTYAYDGVSFNERFREQSYFEYHLYTLSRPTSVLNNQTKQVSLLQARRIPLRKTLEMRGGSQYYENQTQDLGEHVKLGVYLTFTNKNGDLGIPLPAGTVRLYKKDAGGTGQFLGSDSIDHTPRNEDVRLHVGDSFDVTARRKQTNFHVAGFGTYDSSYEFVISNAKKTPQDVLVVEPIPGEWQILAESAPHERTSSGTASWHLRVPADGKTTLTFTTEVKY
jgi:hypothetical protein